MAWGYADIRAKLSTAQDEYAITGLLADSIDARINAPSTPFHFTFYAIHNERPVSSGGRVGKKRPRIDIQIERCGIRPKKFFTFEAKRLRNDAACDVAKSMRDYLGDEGLRRFLSGYYATESGEAVMLGCIQAFDCDHWLALIERAFGDDAATGGRRYANVRSLLNANVIPDFPKEKVSLHEPRSSAPIRIFHLLLDCQ